VVMQEKTRADADQVEVLEAVPARPSCGTAARTRWRSGAAPAQTPLGIPRPLCSGHKVSRPSACRVLQRWRSSPPAMSCARCPKSREGGSGHQWAFADGGCLRGRWRSTFLGSRATTKRRCGAKTGGTGAVRCGPHQRRGLSGRAGSGQGGSGIAGSGAPTVAGWRSSRKALAAGTLGRTVFFGLPGNPTSSLVSFELFVRPALRRLQGHASVEPPRISARPRSR